MDNDQVAAIFNEMAVLLELKGENPFKARAYSNAVRTLEQLNEPLTTLVQENRLPQLKGIGEALQKKISELVRTGRLQAHEDLKKSVPDGLLDLLAIPGLGPKKIKALHDQLGVQSLDQLETACRENRVAALAGFGGKTADKILAGIRFRRQCQSQHLLSEALALAEPMLEALRAHPSVIRCAIAGDLRRCCEIINHLSFVASASDPARVLEAFARLPQVKAVVQRDDHTAEFMLIGEFAASLRIVPDAAYPFALLSLTGETGHFQRLQKEAARRGLTLSETGLTSAGPAPAGADCRSEEDIYRALGFPAIPPELRENRGELDEPPPDRLVEWTDLKGSLHNHSNWSDGRNSLEEIAAFIQGLGCAYWAVTDHSKASAHVNGLNAQRLRRQIHEIAELNRKLADQGTEFRLLTGIEVDILSGGDLDLDEDVLRELDVVVASIHQGFGQSEAEITRRLIRAAQHPCVHIMGHLSGRRLLQRQSYQVNQEAVIEACAEAGTWIELNSNPLRFDLDWRLWPVARRLGVRCVINCDAHRFEQAGYLRLGAAVARKGGLTKTDVVNTLPLRQLQRELARKKSGRTAAVEKPA